MSLRMRTVGLGVGVGVGVALGVGLALALAPALSVAGSHVTAVAGAGVEGRSGGLVDLSSDSGGGTASKVAAGARGFVDRSTDTAGTNAQQETPAVIIDDMSTIAAWKAYPADGVKLDLASDDGALRLDFAFSGGGYAIARREVDLELPANYAITWRIRGQAQPQHLELKLVDETGENVYWHVRRDLAFPAQWEELRSKRRQIGFAWGPGGADRPLRRVKAIEFAVTAGSGGTGSVWLDDLQLVELPTGGAMATPVAEATSQVDDHAPDLVLDGDPGTWWESGRSERQAVLTLDFGAPQEFGGLVVDWLPASVPAEYLVEADAGDGLWRPVLFVKGSNGGRDHLYLPESEAVRVRLRSLLAGLQPPAISEVKVQPLEWAATREAFAMNVAKEAPRGLYPRGMLGEPTAWTVVGQDLDPREGLISTDGALEAGPGGWTLEPFVWDGRRLVTWNEVQAEPSLAGGWLPIPQVTWTRDDWRLTVTAAGAGEPGQSTMVARYRLENRGARPDTLTLWLALRPLQVNPPSQFLNTRGGTARVESVVREGDTLVVNGKPAARLLAPPTGFGAGSFFGGDIVAEWLARGQAPRQEASSCVMHAASGAAWWDFVLPPGGKAEVGVEVALHDVLGAAGPDAGKAIARAEKEWRRKLDRIDLKAPRGLTKERRAVAEEAIRAAKAQAGWILVNRAGPAIQPGTRSYARSWIRDGALTGEALMRLGFVDEARAFLEWYAPHQYSNGKIPCVVDARGADPVPEHDSTGEFIHLVAQVWRRTQDRELLAAMWPRVLRGVEYLESLLATRRTEEFAGTPFAGILPPSISHEGYSAKPMHSYWDDFWCLRGLRDAQWLAGQAGAAGLDTGADAFAGSLRASVAAAMAQHGIAYVPGCADLGDFDATSTTIALDPCDAADVLPPGALEATFEQYWRNFRERRDGGQWVNFTPYEVRCIGAMARLGHADRAWEMTEWFLSQRAVPGWHVWGEIVWNDKAEARFIGDMPHGWVGSDFIRSVGDLVGK